MEFFDYGGGGGRAILEPHGGGWLNSTLLVSLWLLRPALRLSKFDLLRAEMLKSNYQFTNLLNNSAGGRNERGPTPVWFALQEGGGNAAFNIKRRDHLEFL